MSTYTDGLFSEFLARMFLRIHGFRILKSRHMTGRHTGRAEIDIIASRGNLMIFCEVKKRKNLSEAFKSITPSQSIRLRRAADSFIINMSWKGETRFDVIAVCKFRIYWVRGAI